MLLLFSLIALFFPFIHSQRLVLVSCQKDDACSSKIRLNYCGYQQSFSYSICKPDEVSCKEDSVVVFNLGQCSDNGVDQNCESSLCYQVVNANICTQFLMEECSSQITVKAECIDCSQCASGKCLTSFIQTACYPLTECPYTNIQVRNSECDHNAFDNCNCCGKMMSAQSTVQYQCADNNHYLVPEVLSYYQTIKNKEIQKKIASSCQKYETFFAQKVPNNQTTIGQNNIIVFIISALTLFMTL